MSEGPAWSVYSQLGEKGFPPTNAGFVFLRREGKLGQDRCEDVRNYTVQMYLYVRPQLKKGATSSSEKLDLTPAHLRAAAPHVRRVSTCAFLSARVFMCLRRRRDPSSVFTGGPSPGPDGFPANAGTAVTHGNR